MTTMSDGKWRVQTRAKVAFGAQENVGSKSNGTRRGRRSRDPSVGVALRVRGAERLDGALACAALVTGEAYARFLVASLSRRF